MKKIFFLITIFVLLICLSQIVLAEPMVKEYGYVNAWCNGKESTVEDIQLKIGEPAEIKVEVKSKINGHIFLKLTNPLVTESYEVISGPSKIDEYIDNLNIESGWTKTYVWKIKPTGKWTNGNAPINLFVQFHKDINDDETVQFTIANPYILDEQHSGSSPQPTPHPESTGQASSEGSPGFGVVAALVGVAAVLLIRKRD